MHCHVAKAYTNKPRFARQVGRANASQTALERPAHVRLRRRRHALPGLQLPEEGAALWMPDGFETEVDKDGWRNWGPEIGQRPFRMREDRTPGVSNGT